MKRIITKYDKINLNVPLNGNTICTEIENTIVKSDTVEVVDEYTGETKTYTVELTLNVRKQ